MNRVGVDKLRSFLQVLLDTHIERELPNVRDEIKKNLASSEAELKSTGDARPTVTHIRSFMTSLSMRFYELLRAALDGSYQSINVDFFANHEGSRLSSRIQQVNTDFSHFMRDHGERRKIGTDSELTASIEPPVEQLIMTEEFLTWVRKVS